MCAYLYIHNVNRFMNFMNSELDYTFGLANACSGLTS